MPHTEQQPAYAKTSAFACVLGVSERAVRAMCSRGRLPGAMKLGKDWLIPRRVLDDLAAGRPLERQP